MKGIIFLALVAAACLYLSIRNWDAILSMLSGFSKGAKGPVEDEAREIRDPSGVAGPAGWLDKAKESMRYARATEHRETVKPDFGLGEKPVLFKVDVFVNGALKASGEAESLPYRIGRDSRYNDLAVSDNRISAEHALIAYDENHVAAFRFLGEGQTGFAMDPDGSRTPQTAHRFIVGGAFTVWLASNIRLEIVPLAPYLEALASLAQPALTLRVDFGRESKRYIFRSARGECLIGSDKGNSDVAVNEGHISACHAKIAFDGDFSIAAVAPNPDSVYWVEGGSFVNTSHVVREGESFWLGSKAVVLTIEEIVQPRPV